MRTQPRRTRTTRLTSLACAALAGAAAVVGASTPPSAARPDLGAGQVSAVAPAGPGGLAGPARTSFIPGPTLLAGSMGVHVDGGWLLR